MNTSGHILTIFSFHKHMWPQKWFGDAIAIPSRHILKRVHITKDLRQVVYLQTSPEFMILQKGKLGGGRLTDQGYTS